MTIAQMADDLRTMAGIVAEFGDNVTAAESYVGNTVSKIHVYGAENLVAFATKYDMPLAWLPWSVESSDDSWELYGYFNGVIKVFCLCDDETYDRLLYGGADNGGAEDDPRDS